MRLLFFLMAAGLGAIVCGSIAYLILLLCAAISGKRRRFDTSAGAAAAGVPSRLVVVIPAHNEELVLAGTLKSLAEQDYPQDRFEIAVIADNCTDSTAAIARTQNVTVLERENATERGKGYALAWAFSHLLARPDPADAFVIVDADTWVAPDFLRLISTRLAKQADSRGFCALQGRYGVLNGSDGWRAALMAGAFDLFNHIKPLGRERLGLGVGLKGNGMGFTRQLLMAAPWSGSSVTEDIDFGLDLARNHSVRVGYAPEARILAQMPVTASQASSQRERWEGGRFRLVRERALPLLSEGLRRRSAILFDAGIDLMLPPLADLGGLLLLWIGIVLGGAATHMLSHPAIWLSCTGAAMLGLLFYIVGGLRVSDAPPLVYKAMAYAPAYAVWKVCLYAGGFARKRAKRSGGKSPDEWVRTARTPLVSAPGPASAPSHPEGPVE